MNNSDMPAMPNTMDPQTMKELHPDWDGMVKSLAAYTVGLSKREHFAAMAMQGMVSGALANGSTFEFVDVADFALKQADALLAALEKS